MSWLSPLLHFLPLLLFAGYVFSGGTPTTDRWLRAYLLGGGAALAHLAVLWRLRAPANRLALGADLYLLVGGLASLARVWPILLTYRSLKESAIFAAMALVGAATTAWSPQGYVGVRHGDRRRVQRYSLYLLALTVGLGILAFAFPGRGPMGVGIGLVALTLTRRQLIERLGAAPAGASAFGAPLEPLRQALASAGPGARAVARAGSPADGGGGRLLAEIKARGADLDQVRARLAGRATAEGTVRQVDTYFRAPRGRLKLREVEGRPAQLVFYERPDLADVRTSRVALLALPAASDARRLLEAMLGVRVVVAKARETWRLEGVQVQLDRVDGLGDFVELKAVVASSADLPAAQARVRRLMADLGIAPAALEARSYSDLLEAASGPGPAGVSGSAPPPAP